MMLQHSRRLVSSDYDMPCVQLAKNLLGLHLCRRLESGGTLTGVIVETESYLGGNDKASHSFNGRKTERNSPMYMEPGTAYVYSTYGMYYCYNVSSRGEGAAVLIRALEPVSGIEAMMENRVRHQRGKNKEKTFKLSELCNGPSKLCMSFAIDKSLNKEYMVPSEKLWIEQPTYISQHVANIIACRRIGIDSAGDEWASKPLRFYIQGNPYVSKRDKGMERSLMM